MEKPVIKEAWFEAGGLQNGIIQQWKRYKASPQGVEPEKLAQGKILF
jgi:hypothetical protein